MKFKLNKKIILPLIIILIIILVSGGTLGIWKWRTSAEQKTAVTVTITKDFECAIDV